MSPIFLVLNASRPPQIAWGWGRLGLPTVSRVTRRYRLTAVVILGLRGMREAGIFSTALKEKYQPAPPLGWEQGRSLEKQIKSAVRKKPGKKPGINCYLNSEGEKKKCQIRFLCLFSIFSSCVLYLSVSRRVPKWAVG